MKEPEGNTAKREIINADEASAWLKIPKTTLYKLCTEGNIPSAKVGRHWRFEKKVLEEWFMDKIKRTKTKKGASK